MFRAKERIELEIKQNAPKVEKEAAKEKEELANKQGQKWSGDDNMRL